MADAPETGLEEIEQQFKLARQRLLLLDYDGTLVPIFDHPEDSAPSERLISLLKKMSDDARNTIVVISGRPHETLEEWLGVLPIEFIAEHSVMRREKNGKWQMTLAPDHAQYAAGLTMLTELSALYPGTMIEKKRVGIALHYRHAPTLDEAKIKQWAAMNHFQLERLGLREILGKKVLELVPGGVDKGVAARHWLERGGWDFVMAAGDDTTDEAMFCVMSQDDISIHVGDNPATSALHTIPSQSKFIDFLTRLSTT